MSLHFCLILLLPHPQYSFILEQVLPYGLWEHHCSWVWFWINIIETHEHTSIHFIFHKKVILRELFCSFLSWQKDLNEKSHKGSLLGKNAKQIELICFRYSLTTFTHCFFFNFYLFSKLWPEFSGSHMQSQHKGGESQRITDFWDRLGYEFEAG